MPQLVKKRRSGWAVLAAGALVASLLAVGASPVGAAPDKADYTTMLSACVGDALDDHMFTDVSDGHAFKDAINCVAYYGVTNGTGDGSTYSPNQDVTRAEMAVFIARAAKIAGVELKSGSGDFSDIGDVWPDAQDAINGLAASGMIAKGGAFRPDDAVTRAEMASFLIALLAKAAPNVTIDSAGAIKLGSGSNAMEADDYFADSRASQPRANDAEISALYELGVTKGAGPAAVQDDTKPPLDFNYEPAGTVDRGQMAAFITRALAHTRARPEGISAQYDGTNVVVSARDEHFAPIENVQIDVFRTDTGGVGLAFKGDGSCGEVEKVSMNGNTTCEIDNGDEVTGGDGDLRVALGSIDAGGTTVWAWTGETKDMVDDDTDLFRLDIPEGASMSMADRVKVSTEHSAAKAHLGSSVLYTVQLQDANGDVTVGTNGRKPAQFKVRLRIFALEDLDSDPATPLTRTIQVTNSSDLQITTDDDGKATFSVSGLADLNPAVKVDKYEVDVLIRPGSNAPKPVYVDTGVVNPYASDFVPVDAADAGARGGLVFSTEPSSREEVTVTVKPAANFVAANESGASARATVSVTDQYGDPVPNVWCSLTSAGAGDISIFSGQRRNVAFSGTYTFRYERADADAATETLTASCDQDRDAEMDDYTDTATVEWAAGPGDTGTGADIRLVDTDANVIFVGADGSVAVVGYDSNDRFDIDTDGSGSGKPMPSTYAAFERSISDADTLTWEIFGRGSRAVNKFILIKADS
jgi:hypothetical protein